MRPFQLTHKQKNTHKQTTSRLTLTQKKKTNKRTIKDRPYMVYQRTPQR